MEWEEPVVIELTKEPDAEGVCIQGVLGAPDCSTGSSPGGECIAGAIDAL